jgi:hypothetical protein
MLACLIVVPLAAIFGSQFPDVVKTVLIDRFWPANIKLPGEQAQRPESPAFSAGPAPAWRSDAPLAATGGAPGYGNPPVRPTAGSAMTGDPMAGRSAPGVIADGLVRPAAADVAMNPTSGSQPSDSAGPSYSAPGYPASASTPANTAPGAAPPAIAPDRFTWMERKLREQGATYYLLETWVNEGERYRFFCKIALSNNPGHTQNFEATDSDPLRAMGRVVDQVDAWRTGRPQ